MSAADLVTCMYGLIYVEHADHMVWTESNSNN